jgi:hypothetical protein
LEERFFGHSQYQFKWLPKYLTGLSVRLLSGLSRVFLLMFILKLTAPEKRKTLLDVVKVFMAEKLFLSLM